MEILKLIILYIITTHETPELFKILHLRIWSTVCGINVKIHY